MAWEEKRRQNFIIITGDKESYTFLWKDAIKTTEFNISTFEFIDIEGTLVKRSKIKGSKYPLRLYLVGKDHLEIADKFEESSINEGYWDIRHPYFGEIRCQPISISRNNTKHNSTIFDITVIETIFDEYPQTDLEPRSDIAQKKLDLDALYLSSFQYQTELIASTEISDLAVYFYAETKKINTDFSLFELFSNFVATTSNVTATMIRVIQSLKNLFEGVVKFKIAVKQRIDLFIKTWNETKDFFRNFPNLLRLFFAEIISDICLSAINPIESDYLTKEQVLNIIQDIQNIYSSEPIEGDFETEIQLNTLVNTTISNLFNIALGAKQERYLITERDYDLITLSHRLYGLDLQDKNIELLSSSNSISGNEFITIKKGRRIIYYV